MWDIIDNRKVREVWECPDCEDEVNINPNWYQDNGTPVCEECGCDMKYMHTEINNG
jgi:formylmethanofuran dehydrogenase subunit E